MKKGPYLLLLIMTVLMWHCSGQADIWKPDEGSPDQTPNYEYSVRIPTAGNSWVADDITPNSTVIGDQGIQNWTKADHLIRTYFKTKSTGNLQVGLKARSVHGLSTLRIRVGEQSKEVQLDNTLFEDIEVGEFQLEKAGYHYVQVEGIDREGATFADVNELLLGGTVTNAGLTYIKDDFYFGRRGPSVHLRYELPENKDIRWFYSEIEVPEGEDVIGSYFMANGFGEGYFGMQVNSETERRILFSVWSPYDTQNPDDIPEDYKIILLDRGEEVSAGEFGNEGSGGQSYLVYDWKAGNTYKFLLKGEPSVNSSTDYTAYFYAPEVGQWQLIASFRRPYTTTYLTHFYSFLENFIPSSGHIARRGEYKNQWAYDTDGQWHELTKARFTADATARKGNRLDYAGGAEDKVFFMKNCGFFDETTDLDIDFYRSANGVAPDIDFESLE